MEHFIRSLIDVQVEFLNKEHSCLKLNDELFQQIRQDCETVEAHYEELNIRAFSMGFSGDNFDGILEYHFDSLELTPTSPLLTIMTKASEIQFRSEEDEIDNEGLQLILTLVYKNLFSV